MAVFLKPMIEDAFGGSWLWLGFVITAIILMIAQFSGRRETIASTDITNLNITTTKAIAIGFAQGIATFPAISRSGSTIASGLIVGCNRDDVTKYSFLLSIPIIIASTILEVAEYIATPSGMVFNAIELIIGFVIAFLVGIASIHIMTRFVRRQKLYYFSFYLVILAILVLIFI
jgi:undecaprenyl-diphosphatase